MRPARHSNFQGTLTGNAVVDWINVFMFITHTSCLMRKWVTAIRGGFMLSYKIVFSLDLRMKTVSSRLLSCTSYATFFYWPSTFGTKIHTVGELKTTIQALFCNSCTHHLDFAIDSNCNF